MTDLAAMRALHDAVKAGTMPGWKKYPDTIAVNLWPTLQSAFLGSLDAAHALHKAVLPGWDFSVGAGPIQGVNGFAYLTGWQQGETDAEADTPARAWLLAILAAIIAQQEGE